MFTEDDVKKSQAFGQYLLKAKLDQSVGDWIEFNRLLIWFNGVAKKISENVLEVKDVTPKPMGKKSK